MAEGPRLTHSLWQVHKAKLRGTPYSARPQLFRRNIFCLYDGFPSSSGQLHKQNLRRLPAFWKLCAACLHAQCWLSMLSCPQLQRCRGASSTQACSCQAMLHRLTLALTGGETPAAAEKQERVSSGATASTSQPDTHAHPAARAAQAALSRPDGPKDGLVAVKVSSAHFLVRT